MLLYLPLTAVAVVYLLANGVVDPISLVACAVVGITFFRLIIRRSRRQARASRGTVV